MTGVGGGGKDMMRRPGCNVDKWKRVGVNGIRHYRPRKNNTRRFGMGRSRIAKSRKRREEDTTR